MVTFPMFTVVGRSSGLKARLYGLYKCIYAVQATMLPSPNVTASNSPYHTSFSPPTGFNPISTKISAAFSGFNFWSSNIINFKLYVNPASSTNITTTLIVYQNLTVIGIRFYFLFVDTGSSWIYLVNACTTILKKPMVLAHWTQSIQTTLRHLVYLECLR